MIRLLVSDIDGTMVRHDKSLPDANVAAVRRAVTAGISVALISARPPSGMMWIAEALGLGGPHGAFNGATLFTSDGKVLVAEVGSSRVDLQACKLEYSIVSPK